MNFFLNFCLISQFSICRRRRKKRQRKQERKVTIYLCQTNQRHVIISASHPITAASPALIYDEYIHTSLTYCIGRLTTLSSWQQPSSLSIVCPSSLLPWHWVEHHHHSFIHYQSSVIISIYCDLLRSKLFVLRSAFWFWRFFKSNFFQF